MRRIPETHKCVELTGERYGKREFVPTNQMDVVDALSMNDTFHVKHYAKSKEHDREDTYWWAYTSGGEILIS